LCCEGGGLKVRVDVKGRGNCIIRDNKTEGNREERKVFVSARVSKAFSS